MRLKDALFKLGTGIHIAIYRVSRGRLLGRAGGMPVLLLTTTGRKTGRERSTVLTTPVHDADRIVLVASYGGDDRHPAWFLNLRDNPDVGVTMNGKRRRMHARLANGDEKAKIWPSVVAAYGGYGKYQDSTTRDIPVVILEDRVSPLRRGAR